MVRAPKHALEPFTNNVNSHMRQTGLQVGMARYLAAGGNADGFPELKSRRRHRQKRK